MMQRYHLAEVFTSINGEGTKAGQLALFLRFCGCNLHCSFCDTQWANQTDCLFQEMALEEIKAVAAEAGLQNLTVTGGEPLLQPGMKELLEALAEERAYSIEIETNGSIPLAPFLGIPGVSFTMDYKLPGSGEEHQMCRENFSCLRLQDTVKFVAGSQEDLLQAKKVIETYGLIGRCAVYLSPVFGRIAPVQLVEFLKVHRLNGVNMQLQMHKFIWPSTQRGV